jgi:hypothetical protein
MRDSAVFMFFVATSVKKLKDYEAAVRDYTYPIDQKYVNCDLIREKRGDAYAAKGEWSACHRGLLERAEKIFVCQREFADAAEPKAYLKTGGRPKRPWRP